MLDGLQFFDIKLYFDTAFLLTGARAEKLRNEQRYCPSFIIIEHIETLGTVPSFASTSRKFTTQRETKLQLTKKKKFNIFLQQSKFIAYTARFLSSFTNPTTFLVVPIHFFISTNGQSMLHSMHNRDGLLTLLRYDHKNGPHRPPDAQISPFLPLSSHHQFSKVSNQLAQK